MKKQYKKSFLLKILLVSILIILATAIFFAFLRTSITGNAVSLDAHSYNMHAKIIFNDDSKITARITNNDVITYYIEKIIIENCDEFSKIIPIDSGETKDIEISCSELSDKNITIFYKKQGNSEVFEYITQ